MSENRDRIKQTIFFYCSLFAVGLIAASIGPALPTLAKNTGVNICTAGLIFTSNSFGFLLGSFIGGEIFNRFSGNPFLSLSLLVITVAVWFIPVCTNFFLLLSIIFFHGISVSIIIVGTNTLIGIVRRLKTDMWMNGMHFCFGIGALLSPVILTYYMVNHGEIITAYRIFAVIILITGLFGISIKSPVMNSETTQYRNDVSWGSIIFFGMIFFLYVGAEVSFSGWIYSYVIKIHTGAEKAAGLITSYFWIAFTVGRLVAVPLSTRLSAYKMLLLDYSVSLSALALIYSFNSITAMSTGTVLFGFAMASIFPSALNYAGKTINLDSRTNGILFALGSAGAMIIPFTTGFLFEKFSHEFIIYSIFIPQFIGLLMIFLAGKLYKK